MDVHNSGEITRSDLGEMNKKLGLNLSETDMNLMMEMAGADGQKVTKKDLFEFLSSNDSL